MHSYALWVLILSVSQLPCPTVSGKSSSPLSVDYDLVPFTIRRQLHWTSLIDWHNPANWLPDRRLPCAKDRIALPEDFLLFLNHQLDATELVLPQNGELVLGPQGNIRLLTQPDGELAASCPAGVSGSNLEFTPSEKSHPSSWFSPLNWRLVFPPPERGNTQGTWGAAKQRAISNFATFLTPGRDGVAAIVPHSERIPCTGDWVHFPTTNGSFKVTIERSSQVPTLRQLSIGPLLFGSSTRFNEYVKSFRGELLFAIGDYNHLQISERLSGQSCGNDSPKKLANICLHVQSTCRERDALPCADPITPKGHCCPLCASALIAKSNGSTDLAQRILETALRANHRLLPWLRLYGHQLYDGRWQVIVEDLPVDGSIRGEHLNDAYIQKLKATLRYFNFQVHSVSSSVLWLEDSHLLGTIVWICFALFLLSLASYPLYTYYQRNR